MKKITSLIFTIVFLILVSECSGYKPIFASKNLQFNISEYSIEGNKILGNKIYSRLYNLSKSKKDDKNLRNINFIIEVSKEKKATVKNNAGKILEYKITLSSNVEVIDFITEDKILNQVFISSLTYKVQDKYSDTIDLENRAIENLLNKIYQELVTRLAQNIIIT